MGRRSTTHLIRCNTVVFRDFRGDLHRQIGMEGSCRVVWTQHEAARTRNIDRGLA